MVLDPISYKKAREAKELAQQSPNVIIEVPGIGYPSRPNVTLVTWIGPNQPSEAEPYDEWREVEGFTYFTDFSNDNVGTIPIGWEQQWGDSLESFEVIEQENGEKQLAVKSTTNALHFVSWSESNDLYNLDSEVYLKGYISYASHGPVLSAVHRGSSESETGYTIGIRHNSSSEASMEISKKTNGTSTSLKLLAVDIDLTSPFHQLSRVDGDRLRVKIWQEGEAEPSDWLIDITDGTPIEEKGLNGVYWFMLANTNYVSEFGVGTGGMRAPRRKLIG